MPTGTAWAYLILAAVLMLLAWNLCRRARRMERELQRTVEAVSAYSDKIQANVDRVVEQGQRLIEECEADQRITREAVEKLSEFNKLY